MNGRRRQTVHEPIVAAQGGNPPAWVVSCAVCGFQHDAHGATAAEAIRSVKHEPSHTLEAQPVDYTTGFGPNGDEPHPFWR